MWAPLCVLSFSKVSFMTVAALAFRHRCSELRISLVDFSFDDYEVSFLISLDNFLLKVYFIGYMDDISSLFLGTICLEDLFPAFYSELGSVTLT